MKKLLTVGLVIVLLLAPGTKMNLKSKYVNFEYSSDKVLKYIKNNTKRIKDIAIDQLDL